MTLITDSMAGHFMSRGKVDLVVVGADRIAANGDVANKIGTYTLAVLAREHGIPFYVAAPISTVDLTLAERRRDPDRGALVDARSSRSPGTRIAPDGVTRRAPGLRRDARAPGHRDHHRARRAARAVRGGAGRRGPRRDAAPSSAA